MLGELRARTTGGPLAPSSQGTVCLPTLSAPERTLADHHAVGVDLEGHPMRHLRTRLRTLGVLSISGLRAEARSGQRATTAGLVIVRQRPGTAKGFVFLGLEDETGRLDVIVSPKAYARG